MDSTLSKTNLLALALMIGVALFGVGFVSAHGGAEERASTDWHSRMQDVLTSGDYNALMHLREETGMPMLPWVRSQADFERAQDYYQEYMRNSFSQMPCHR